jgi:DNA-binding response OmpR family regulator
VLGALEDWLREPYDTVDLYARREGLRRRLDARSPVVFDQDGLLHRGRRWVDLSPRELRLVRALLEREGAAVARGELAVTLYGAGAADATRGPATERAVDGFVRRARIRLAPLGLAIHTVRGFGYMIQVRDLPT